MLKLGMVGKVLIHNYPYGAYFNGVDDKALAERCTKKWMQPLIQGRFAQPVAKGSRITHVWAGDRKESEAIAACCRIGKVCDSLDEVIANVDGVFILDEDIPSRTEAAERCLRAGKSIYVDKVLSLSVDKTRELVSLAQQKNLRVAAWSQVLFAPEAEPFRAHKGGAGLVTFNLGKDIVAQYGVHLVCAAYAAFGADPVGMAKADTGPDGAPAIILTYADGKNVVLRAGKDVPGGGTVAYIGPKAGPVTAKLAGAAQMFDGSAAALEAMFERGAWPMAPEALVRMAEACALLAR
ncbi:MAG: hypothetical protein FJ272_11045 [Planctomycetes bacterium]|nr:hypothetical protein [Planctomycetota bacterium]